ncbi:Methyltransferase-like protein 7A [Lamellibrachia satsuma]|nr:Methyltransferase-like protein 7A [Lamellibrachia satsuma]
MDILGSIRNSYNNVYGRVYASIINNIGKGYTKAMNEHKAALFEGMTEQQAQLQRPMEIVEVGVGAGMNLKYYPNDCQLTAVDPYPQFEEYLKTSMEKYPLVNVDNVRFVVGRAEDLSMIPSDSVDAAVCTTVLCNVDDVDKSLSEIKRVLRPGGKFYYIEHVCADEGSWVRTFQLLINPVWKRISDGCNMTRETGKHVERAGFSQVEQTHFSADTLTTSLVKPHVKGVATK